MHSPYDSRESGERITAKYLAQRLRAFGAHRSSATVVPGSVVGLEDTELEGVAALLETNFGDEIPRVFEPYANDISRSPATAPSPTSRKLAVLLRGAVEVQAPFQSELSSLVDSHEYYPVTVLRAPALIWLFEAIPDAGIGQHQVRILSGVQSFAVLLSLSQLQPWKRIAKRWSTNIPYHDLEASAGSIEAKHTNLFRWSRRWRRAPQFSAIAHCHSPEWFIELAILEVGHIFGKPYDRLSEQERRLRDTLYRIAIRRFGDSLKRHVPGYRIGPTPTTGRRPPAENIRTVASFMREIYTGAQPYHTCCSNFDQACHLFPAKTLTWNIFDFIRLAIGKNVSLAKFRSTKRSTNDELDRDTMVTFFDEFLCRYVYTPSFSAATDICLYSPVLWAHDDMNHVLRSFDPRHAINVQRTFTEIHKTKIRDFHIKTVPAFFRATSEYGGGVPASISQIIMDGGVFFRKSAE